MIRHSALTRSAPPLVLIPVIAFVLLAAAPQPAVAGEPEIVFDSGFEAGDASEWSAAVPELIPRCDCYFSGDCPAGQFCDWGILSAEDNCTFKLPKPQGVIGAGCNVDFPDPWQLGICDGRCVPTSLGSRFGGVDPVVLAEGARLWSEAVLRPAEAGGGPVDPELAAAAEALPLGGAESMLLGRHVVSLLVEASSLGFYDHFCHFEAGDNGEKYFVDLSENRCAVRVGRLTIEALAAELVEPGSGAGALDEVPLLCHLDSLAFGSACGGGAAGLACFRQRVADTARFLTTPRLDAPLAP